MSITFTVSINGKLYPKAVFPLKTADLLDEQLDEAYLTMVLCKEEHFDMLSRVQIDARTKNAYGQITSEKSFNYVIANDRSVLTIKDKKLYKHEIYLIEETKLLEGLVGDSIVFTNALGNLYLENKIPVQYVVDFDNGISATVKTPNYYTPEKVGENYNFLSANQVFDYEEGPYIGEYNFTTTIYYEGEQIFTTEDRDDIFSVVLEQGTYKAEYQVRFSSSTGNRRATIHFDINAASNRYPLKKWTITDVVQRTLDLIEP